MTAWIEHCVDRTIHADLALHCLGDARVHTALNRRFTRLLFAYGQIYLAGHGTGTTAADSIENGLTAVDPAAIDGRHGNSHITSLLVQLASRLIVHLAARVLYVEHVALAQLSVLVEHRCNGPLEIPRKLVGHHAAHLVAYIERMSFCYRSIQARGNWLLRQLYFEILAVVVIIYVLQLEGAPQRLCSGNGTKGDAVKKRE